MAPTPTPLADMGGKKNWIICSTHLPSYLYPPHPSQRPTRACKLLNYVNNAKYKIKKQKLKKKKAFKILVLG